MEKTSPAKFVRQVRQEVNKVTWPTRRETMVSTVMVLIISALAAVYFLLVDSLSSKLVKFILNLGA